MLVTAIPPGANLTQWLYNMFAQIKNQNESEAAATDSAAEKPSANTVPIISNAASNAASEAQSGMSYVTASYGMMILGAEVAFPGSLTTTSSAGDSGEQATNSPDAVATAVAASQAMDAYMAAARATVSGSPFES